MRNRIQALIADLEAEIRNSLSEDPNPEEISGIAMRFIEIDVGTGDILFDEDQMIRSNIGMENIRNRTRWVASIVYGINHS